MIKASGTLYIVATPIGNLKDITFRAIEILKNADFIAAEDTRRTKILLKHYKINTSLLSYYEHNEIKRIPKILSRIDMGENVAVVSDAGTPTMSDPAYKLIREAINVNIRVESIPGASAILAGLTSSGLPTDRFLVEGFFPTKKNRKSRLENLRDENATVVFFENPNRLQRTLNDILRYIGDRPAVICREMTKIHEEYIRGTVSTLIEHIKKHTLKGECVLLIGKNKSSVYFN